MTETTNKNVCINLLQYFFYFKYNLKMKLNLTFCTRVHMVMNVLIFDKGFRNTAESEILLIILYHTGFKITKLCLFPAID